MWANIHGGGRGTLGEGKRRERQDSLSSGPQKDTAKTQALQQVKGVFLFLAGACSSQPRQSANHKVDPVPSEGGDLSLAAEPSAEGRSEAPGSWQSLQELEARDAHGHDTLHQGVDVGGTLSPQLQGEDLSRPPSVGLTSLSILPWPAYSWHTGKCQALGIGAQRLSGAC